MALAVVKMLSSKVLVLSNALVPVPSPSVGSVIAWLLTRFIKVSFSSFVRYFNPLILSLISRFLASIAFSFSEFLAIAALTTLFIASWVVFPVNWFLKYSFSFGERYFNLSIASFSFWIVSSALNTFVGFCLNKSALGIVAPVGLSSPACTIKPAP